MYNPLISEYKYNICVHCNLYTFLDSFDRFVSHIVSSSIHMRYGQRQRLLLSLKT